MSISPFSVRPVSPETDRRRARLVLAIATVGIAATLLAYAISPGVRHAVHSVKGAVGHVLDKDKKAKQGAAPLTTGTPTKTTPTAPTKTTPTATTKSTPTATTPTVPPAGG